MTILIAVLSNCYGSLKHHNMELITLFTKQYQLITQLFIIAES